MIQKPFHLRIFALCDFPCESGHTCVNIQTTSHYPKQVHFFFCNRCFCIIGNYSATTKVGWGARKGHEMWGGRLVSATVWYHVSDSRLIAGIFTMVSPDNVSCRRRESRGGHLRTAGLLGHTAKRYQVRASPIEPPRVQPVWRDTQTDWWTLPPYNLPATTRNVKTRAELGHFGKVSRKKWPLDEWDSILLWKPKKNIILRVVSYER